MFNDSLVDVPADDLYYLLQTFSSMALSRELQEWDFVVRVTMDIFQVKICANLCGLSTDQNFVVQIGFVNESTKELCYKISRDLMVNITTLHPFLISSILAEIKENYETVRANKFAWTLLSRPTTPYAGRQCRFSVQIAAAGQMEANDDRFRVRSISNSEQQLRYNEESVS